MRRRNRKGALLEVIGHYSPKLQTESLKTESANTQHKANACGLHSLGLYVNMTALSRKTGGRLGSLRYLRRLIAAPLRGVFLLAFNRAHGVSMPITLTGAPYGNPIGLSLPKGRSANLYGVAHLLGRGMGFTTDNLTLGK